MLAGDSNWRELVAHHGIAVENGRKTKELILA
jgi:hypothetical protein